METIAMVALTAAIVAGCALSIADSVRAHRRRRREDAASDAALARSRQELARSLQELDESLHRPPWVHRRPRERGRLQ